jgi:hypothetical protein
MLSFQVIDAGRAIQVHCDAQGLATLISSLEKLRTAAGHIHLRSGANGGSEPNETTPCDDEAIGEVIVSTGGDQNDS